MFGYKYLNVADKILGSLLIGEIFSNYYLVSLTHWLIAGITPASGFMQTYFAGVSAVFIGLASYGSIILFKHKMKLDDALDVSSVSS